MAQSEENKNLSAGRQDRMVQEKLSFEQFKKIVLDDYRISYESREASLTGRKGGPYREG